MAIQRTQRGHGGPVWSLHMSMSNERLDCGPRGSIHSFSAEAERWASGAANSGSEARADAVCRRLNALVRCGIWQGHGIYLPAAWLWRSSTSVGRKCGITLWAKSSCALIACQCANPPALTVIE